MTLLEALMQINPEPPPVENLESAPVEYLPDHVAAVYVGQPLLPLEHDVLHRVSRQTDCLVHVRFILEPIPVQIYIRIIFTRD